ncbi:MAG: HEPN domain-containing protein [Deltaproteobacteria bacterium]|nr:HEPN domain-containing protein [Deltaproteobacteria bacterium]
MKFITSEWLKSADDDINTIKAIIDDESLTHIVAFHSQQCIEKSFKAMVDEFELASQKIHNLITLNETISSIYQFDFDEDKLGLLNKLYLDSRYPGDLGLLPNGKPSIEVGKEFQKLAKEIYERINTFIKNRDKQGPNS